MNETPDISYDEVQPNYLNFNDIHIILKLDKANLSNYRKILLSKGIINFSAYKESFAKDVSTINFGLEFASDFINEIYSKGKFELGICSITLKRKIDVNEFSQLLSERAQDIIDFDAQSRLRPVHIERNKFVHIKLVYPSIFWGGKRYLNINLTSYGIGILKEQGDNTKFDIYIIIKHDRDYTIMRDGLRKIFYDYFNYDEIEFDEFCIPIDNTQPNILERAFNEIDKNFDAFYLTAGNISRLGERDDSKSIIHRSQETIFKRFELEEPQEIVDFVKKENWAFNSISFTFLDDKYPELIFVTTYSFGKYKTTVKFETAKIFNDDINDSIYNPETGERSYNKLDQLNEEYLNYGDKFSILLGIITKLKDNT
ncbi:MAG: hypothetical protein V3V33_04560 [Candidatus Lokiarchaeia archaeon]